MLRRVGKAERLDVERLKPFTPGPHGAFEFGASADFKRVLITAHYPEIGTIDFLVELNTARSMLEGLAKAVSLVAEDSTDTTLKS